ncbi:MAG: ABC transporter substrate-binding protein [Treponema sp.]|jgi:peptide/nickel transport system substrate-binding protein|nr:ABC transporter substrate-binding protein [Treponema sp.]
MKKMLYMALSAACVLGLLVLSGCPGSKGKELTFTVALSEDIRAVDPGLAWNYVTNQVTNQITEGLVTLDTKNNVVPELAKSWSQPDALTYVYEVRDDIVFSDGSKMTMDDVLFSFERYANPNGGTWFSDFYDDVESFSVNGWTFTIKLRQPSAVFKYIPAFGAGRIIKKSYYESLSHYNDKGELVTTFGSAKGGIVATGPFVYQSWDSGQEIVLKKNANYWNKEKLAANIVDTLVFKIIPEDTTRVMALQRGDVDFCVNLPVDMLGQLSGSPDLEHVTTDSYNLTYLALNTQRAPMNDVNVRRAISRAFNIPEFHRNIIKTAGSPGTILPFGPALYGENAENWRRYLNNAPPSSFDLAAARAHLARSAYPGGFDCDLIVSENSLANQRALYIQEALRAIGITVTIRRMSGDEQDTHQMGNVRDANDKRDYDMLIGGWEADYPDLDGTIGTMYAASQAGEDGYNAAAYVNTIVDALIVLQRATLDPARRFELQSQMMDIIVNDVPYVVFDYTYRHSILNKKYTGLSISPIWLWVIPVQNVRLAK